MKIKQFLEHYFCQEVNDDYLLKDLLRDSLDIFDFIMEVNDRFDMTIDIEDIFPKGETLTIGDLIRIIDGQ